jgi:NADPH-dependent 2,4-dienoyl-CoA reductase/sulfur reductase-like enzyme
MPTRYLIVGQGVAGIAAAEAIRAADASGEITLLSDDPHGYYSRPGLAYYLTGEVPRAHLFPWREQDFAQRGLRRMQGRALSLDPAGHRLLLADGSALAFDRLLLATGSAAVRPNLPNIDLPPGGHPGQPGRHRAHPGAGPQSAQRCGGGRRHHGSGAC